MLRSRESLQTAIAYPREGRKLRFQRHWTTAGRKPLWSYADGLHETCSLPTLRRGHVFNVRRTSASTGLSMPTPIFAQETL